MTKINHADKSLNTFLVHLKSGLYSEKIGEVYSNSSRFKKFITARRHLWALLSDIAHLFFIYLTLGEEKTMPDGDLAVYCLLLILDSICTYKITQKFANIFEPRMSLLVAGLLLYKVVF